MKFARRSAAARSRSAAWRRKYQTVNPNMAASAMKTSQLSSFTRKV